VIKLVFCLRRRPELTAEAFQAYWREQHGPLVRRLAPTLKIRRYVQSETVFDPQLAAPVAARGAEVAPYDGVAELWWDDLEALVSVGASAEGRAAGRELLADERRFIDMEASPLFFAREHAIV
jgi:uncharacterized protein (TIGR02118 family)